MLESVVSRAEQLWQFTRHVLLPAVPRLAWWALVLLLFSSLNLLFQRELWPHHPQAEEWFLVLLVAILAVLPWLVAYTAQRLTHQVRRWWWRGFWQLIAVGACVVAVVLPFIALIGTLISIAH